MKFGEFPLNEAIGGILAHSQKLSNGKRIAKGTVVDHDLVARLRKDDFSRVSVAILEEGDLGEDDAATLIARLFEHPSIRIEAAGTGRANMFAAEDGVFCVDRDAINAINAVDPDITLATLNNLSPVNAGRMIATVKIIPYGVSRDSVEKITALGTKDMMQVKAFGQWKIGVISTLTPALKLTTVEKTLRVLSNRIHHKGLEIVADRRVLHDQSAVELAIIEVGKQADFIIIFGASAISDRRDIIPTAVENAGGEVISFGMPVDPGNLLLVGKYQGKPVLGAPGCARSPAENGFDWVLFRLLAGIDVGPAEIAELGVGGLLMEIGSRPSPRDKLPKAGAKKVAAIVLAGGQSRRMGETNKLEAEINGKALVRHVGDAAIQSRASSLHVVTGHEPEKVKQLLDGVEASFHHNSLYEEGLSTSLATGISALADDTDFAMILLADMPFVTSEMLDKMIYQAEHSPAGSIIMATSEGKRGNPVIWPRAYFEALCAVEGDVGARHIIGQNREMVVEVELGAAALLDVDTPEALLASGGWLGGQ